MKKLNCWEYKKCGREPEGAHVHDLGVCPATQEKKLNGTHSGKNAGRSCWILTGTLCKGEVQGTFSHKHKNCELCDFYKNVKEEEYPNFKLSATLLGILNK